MNERGAGDCRSDRLPFRVGGRLWYDDFIPSEISRLKDLPLPGIEKRTISLPAAQASYVDGLVEAGTYASASEVVRAGLRALQERDETVARWLREEVAPVYDAMQADPGRGLSAGQVTAALAAHHAARLKKKGRGDT